MIEIQDVSKQFDCVTALRHLTLKVQDGSVFGLVGSNGAGKSTLLRILAGVYRPVTICGSWRMCATMWGCSIGVVPCARTTWIG